MADNTHLQAHVELQGNNLQPVYAASQISDNITIDTDQTGHSKINPKEKHKHVKTVSDYQNEPPTHEEARNLHGIDAVLFNVFFF